MGKETWGTSSLGEVYPCALHKSKDNVQHCMPSHYSNIYNHPQPLCSFFGSNTGKRAKLATSPITHQVQACHSDKHPPKTYDLNMKCLSLRFEAALYCCHLHHYYNCLLCMVGPHLWLYFFDKRLGKNF